MSNHEKVIMLDIRQQQAETKTELKFPAGLKVLVVDDDISSLETMYKILRRCQFYVTTTNKARTALKILKDSQTKYDIVISDLEMPDISGIKLLQLVGLQMDIPVVMLSSFSDTKRVMKGVKNGACDYLVKPVRIQELQNIWQHVLRKKNQLTLKRRPSAIVIEDDEGGPNRTNNNAAPQESLSGRRLEENGNGNGHRHRNRNSSGGADKDDGIEAITSRKPRLFWSVELHQKFVNAVNIIGLDKAFPKRILDIMDVQGLTREKVASHLQKYRLYLRRCNEGSFQSGSKISSFEEGNISQLGGGYGVFNSLAGRLNTPSSLSFRGLGSSPMLHIARNPNSNTSFPTFGNIEPATPSPSPNPNATTMFQGLSSVQQNNPASIYKSPNSIMPNQNLRTLGNQSPLAVPSPNNGGWKGIGGSGSNLMDPSRFPIRSNWGTPSSYPQEFLHNLFTSDIQNGHNPHNFISGFASANVKGNSLNGNGINNFNHLGQSQIGQHRKQDCVLDSYHNMYAALNSLIPAVDPANHNLGQKIGASPLIQPEGNSLNGNITHLGQPQIGQDGKRDCILNFYTNMSAPRNIQTPLVATANHNLSQKIGASPLIQLDGNSLNGNVAHLGQSKVGQDGTQDRILNFYANMSAATNTQIPLVAPADHVLSKKKGAPLSIQLEGNSLNGNVTHLGQSQIGQAGKRDSIINFYTNMSAASNTQIPLVAPAVHNLSQNIGARPSIQLEGNSPNGNVPHLGQSQIGQDGKQDCILNSYTNLSAAANTQIPLVAPANHNLSQNTGAPPSIQLEGLPSEFMQQLPNIDPNINLDDMLLDDPNLIVGSAADTPDYLEELLGIFLKQDNDETAAQAAGDDTGIDHFFV